MYLCMRQYIVLAIGIHILITMMAHIIMVYYAALLEPSVL